jgi:sulfate permease, SulP family
MGRQPVASGAPALIRSLREIVRPQFFFPRLLGSIVPALVSVLTTVSLATLIFNGPLAPYATRAIGLSLLGALIMGFMTIFISSLPGAIVEPQDVPVVVLAVGTTGLIGAMPAGTNPETLFATVLIFISLSSILCGVGFILLGQFRLGGLTRYLPYPVIGGFLAGSGWLLVSGGINIITDDTLIASLTRPDLFVRWVPGFLFGLILLILLTRWTNLFVMPSFICIGVICFYLVLWFTGTSPDEARAAGWLPGPYPEGNQLQLISPAELALVDWGLIFGQSGTLGSVVLMSAIVLLLNATALEVATRKDIQLNYDLKIAGAANIVAGLVGCYPGYHSLEATAVLEKLGLRGRFAVLIITLCNLVPLLLGAAMLAYMPKFMLGGLVIYLGLTLLLEWVYQSFYKLPRLDYAVIIFISLVIAWFDFLQGVAVGLIVAVILFVINYSRINVVRIALSGSNRSSRYTRSREQRELLSPVREQIYMLELQGFIFFGTAHRLLEQVRELSQNRQSAPLRFLLLDFRQVTGLDSSATYSFVKLQQLAEANEFRVVCTHLSPSMTEQFERIELLEGDYGFCVMSDLDRGIEWCEDQLLASVADQQAHSIPDLYQQLVGAFGPAATGRLLNYLERKELAAGEFLMRQGDPANDLYFIERGLVSACLEKPPGPPVRLQSMASENVVGEIGMYLGATRTSAVVVDEPSVLYRLSSEALATMQQHDPEIAAALHQYIARLMAERLAHTIRALDVVLR